MKDSVAILCGGGPAPGINSVISSVALVFLKSGYRVIGIHEGYKGLFAENPKIQEIDFHFADDIHKRGGSALKMSRHKPKDSEFNTIFLLKTMYNYWLPLVGMIQLQQPTGSQNF